MLSFAGDRFLQHPPPPPPRLRKEQFEVDCLYLPGFNKSPDREHRGFSGECMLCNRQSILTILLKTPPQISTPNFPAVASQSSLAFPLAMSNFAENDVISFYICCDACALYLVRNYASPLLETVTGALPLVPLETNLAAWLESVDLALKGRFRKTDIPALFVSILDRAAIQNELRADDATGKALFRDAVAWAKQDLIRTAQIPNTLSSSFAPPTVVDVGTRSLASVLSDKKLLDASSPKNTDLLLLRYPVPGFLVFARLMRDRGCPESQGQTQIFQRLVFHLTEVFVARVAEQGVAKAVHSLDDVLRQNFDPARTLAPCHFERGALSDFTHSVSIQSLLLTGLLDPMTLASFRTLDEFKTIEEKASPAIAVFLHHLVAYNYEYKSPVDCFNVLKIIPTLIEVITTPLAISEEFSQDLILESRGASTIKN
jgi:hypothetical protein